MLWGLFRDAVPSPSPFIYAVFFPLSFYHFYSFFPFIPFLYLVPVSLPFSLSLLGFFREKGAGSRLSDVESPFTFSRKQRRGRAFTISLSA